MSTIAIDINDAALVVADASRVLATEPGYAHVDGGQILTGRRAYAMARLHPRHSNNRYWEDLSLEPGSAGIDSVVSAAELAYAQLASLWEAFGASKRDAVLLVPSHYGREQLGILLGLAQECGIPVRCMVSSAVAAAATPYPGFQLLHVDAGLHRVAVTPLEQADEVAAQAPRFLHSAGIASVVDKLAKRIAELFVLATRFDPLHSATSEQLLYDRLPQWLEALEPQPKSLTLTLPHGDEDLTVEVEREQLMSVVGGFYRAVVQLVAQAREPGAPVAVLLADRLAALPGIVAELQRLDDAQVIVLEPGQAPVGVLRHDGALGRGGEGVRLLKRLPWREPAARVETTPEKAAVSATAPQSVQGGEAASHIVYRGTAYAVDAQGLLIGRERAPDRRTIVLNGGQGGVSRAHCELVRRDGELKLIDLSSYGTFVNEKRVSGEIALRPADVVRIGSPGEQLQVVRVEGQNGT